jgi:hypothetical protein
LPFSQCLRYNAFFREKQFVSLKDVKSRRAVLNAMAECRHLGREAFQKMYGFGAALSYVLRHNGVEYDSKAIIAVAHKYQFPEQGALPNDFSGGKNTAGRQLMRLGFEVDGVAPGVDDWRLAEIEAVVADYFELMALVRGQMKVNKSARIVALQGTIAGRNASSISRKQSNISAILDSLGLPWVPGLPPLANVQTLLEAVINDWLVEHPDFLSEVPPTSVAVLGQAEVEVPPPSGLTLATVARARRAVRTDFAARDERNRKLGRAGEEWALKVVRDLLIAANRGDLAERVEWVSQTRGDGLGYDIASFDTEGRPQLIEVKTTNGTIGAPFMLSANEVAASADEIEKFVLMRVFDFSTAPRFYRLTGSLTTVCHLEPKAYSALPA